MTTETAGHGAGLEIPRRRRWLRWVAGVVLLALLPVACELPRWRALPDDPLPVAESGPGAGGAEARRALVALTGWLTGEPVTGLTTCVAVAGEVLWCSAAGFADMKSRVPLTPESSMRIGSVSKTLTAMLLARLWERGLVDLDRPIGELLPELPEQLRPLTLRQLASHTAGVRHYRWRLGWPPHQSWSRRAYGSVTESLTIFAADPLLFDPGSGFQYSTHGYNLLGAVLTNVGKASFGELLERELVAPLGLESTTLDSTRLEPGWARSYEVLGGWYRSAMKVDNSRMWPGGGIRSSARDMTTLASSLPQGDLLGSETLERFLTPQPLDDGSANPQNYALGWRQAQTREFLGGRESYRVAHHGGVSSGGSAFLLLFPDQALSVAMLTNTRTGSSALIEPAFDIAEPFMASLLGIPAPPAKSG